MTTNDDQNPTPAQPTIGGDGVMDNMSEEIPVRVGDAVASIQALAPGGGGGGRPPKVVHKLDITSPDPGSLVDGPGRGEWIAIQGRLWKEIQPPTPPRTEGVPFEPVTVTLSGEAVIGSKTTTVITNSGGYWSTSLPADRRGAATVSATYKFADARPVQFTLVDRNPPEIAIRAPQEGQAFWNKVEMLSMDHELTMDHDLTISDPLKLAEVFHQAFQQLTLPKTQGASESVNQLRIVVEVLRRFLASSNVTVAGAQYRLVAYQSLLNRIGTSYEELRLARCASTDARKQLADHLGITLAPTRPDQIDDLTLSPDQLTEETLTRIFGLADTAAPLTPSADSQLKSWRIASVRASWAREDHRPDRKGSRPIIDPDLIIIEDILTRRQGAPAFDLWNERQGWLIERWDEIQRLRQGHATDLAAFDTVLSAILDGSIVELDRQQREGHSITRGLADLGLTFQAFGRLCQIRQLAERSTLLEAEWDDVANILIQTQKYHVFTTWRDEERQRKVTLSDEHFDLSAARPELPRWRARLQDRRDWQAKLRARKDQLRAIKEELDATIATVEEQTLPLLRDELVDAVGTADNIGDTADWLSDRLLIDVRASGAQRTTRVQQAIETLQGLIFSVYTRRFDNTHPADAWGISDQLALFSDGWPWMRSYAMWRAAKLVFLYPENALQPRLEPPVHDTQTPQFHQTKAFVDHILTLRNQAPVTLNDVVSKVDAYGIPLVYAR